RMTGTLARKDGTPFQAASAAAAILDGAGRVTHFVVVIRDITEDLRLRGQLVRSERLSAIGEFVAGVAHEINNPLQSIIGTLELAGIQITEEYAPVLPLVLASRDEIQQVLLNLVINAQQAMADSTAQRVLSVRTHLIRGDAVVDVCDTGPGVPEAIAGKIFEP